MGGGGRDGADDLGGVGVAEVDAGAEHDHGNEQAGVGEQGLGEDGLAGVDAEGEHDDQGAGAGGDGEGEGVKGFALELGDFGFGDGGERGFGLFGAGGAVFLVEEAPADHGDDDATGDLHDGQRDSKEAEEGGADEGDDDEKDGGIDGDLAGEGAVDLNGREADEAEEDKGRTERIDQGEEGAEAEGEEFPDLIHVCPEEGLVRGRL